MKFSNPRPCISIELRNGVVADEFYFTTSDKSPTTGSFEYVHNYAFKTGGTAKLGRLITDLFTVDMLTTFDFIEYPKKFRTEYFRLVQLDSNPTDIPIGTLLNIHREDGWTNDVAVVITANTAFDRSNDVFLAYKGRIYKVVSTGLSESAPVLFYEDIPKVFKLMEKLKDKVDCDKCNYPGCPKDLSDCMLKKRFANYKPIFGEI